MLLLCAQLVYRSVTFAFPTRKGGLSTVLQDILPYSHCMIGTNERIAACIHDDGWDIHEVRLIIMVEADAC
jgi:hypothetical protein